MQHFTNRPPLAEDEYFVTLSIPMEDPLLHTESHPFCDDLRCPCHNDWDNRKILNDAYFAGLLTWAEATRIYQGGAV